MNTYKGFVTDRNEVMDIKEWGYVHDLVEFLYKLLSGA